MPILMVKCCMKQCKPYGLCSFWTLLNLSYKMNSIHYLLRQCSKCLQNKTPYNFHITYQNRMNKIFSCEYHFILNNIYRDFFQFFSISTIQISPNIFCSWTLMEKNCTPTELIHLAFSINFFKRFIENWLRSNLSKFPISPQEIFWILYVSFLSYV